MAYEHSPLPVRFYRTATGTEPVRTWLRDLPPSDRRLIGLDLYSLQRDWPVGMPLCRSMGEGLWEMRSHLEGNRVARLLFFLYGGSIGTVHGFIKKTRATPHGDLDLARRRMKEMLR
jgi:phage-related protein